MLAGRPVVLVVLNSLAIGGAERHTVSLVSRLRDKFEFVVAYLHPQAELVDEIHKDSVRLIKSIDAQPGLDLAAVGRVSALMDQHQAQLILAVNGYSLLYSHLARLRSRKNPKIVTILHSGRLATLKERLQMTLYWPLYRRSDGVIYVSDAQRDYWQGLRLSGGKSHTIHNGIDLNWFSADRVSEVERAEFMRQHELTVDDKVIGICAGIRPEKRHEDLVRAIALLKHRGMPWKLLVIGDGPNRAQLEEFVRSQDMAENVKITGYLNDVRTAISVCRVVALVSSTEAFSIAALEAMAMGKPMVMSDVGGAREQVTNGVNGFLVPVGSSEQLAGSLERLSRDEISVASGLASRIRVEQMFSEELMINKYAKLLSLHCS